MEPLHVFRTIEIPIEGRDGKTETVVIPFTVELLERTEETIRIASQRSWWRLKPSDKNMVQAFEDFCRPYLPADFDFKRADPTFCALFFSRVRNELTRSFNACMQSANSTDE